MKSFFTLELAVAFAQDCERAKLPKHLKDQFLRASSSVALNLAEGAAKPTEADRKRFYYIALGSLRECQTILKISSGAGVLRLKADDLGACVYKLCKSVG